MLKKFLLVGLIFASGQSVFAQNDNAHAPQTFTAQGVTIEFTATPRGATTRVVANEEAEVRFKITAATTPYV
jgi:hypothetical protein